MSSITVAFIVLFLLTLVHHYLKLVYFTLYRPIPGILSQFLVGNLIQTGIFSRKTKALTNYEPNLLMFIDFGFNYNQLS